MMFVSKSMSVRLLFFANTFLKFIFCSLDRYGPSLIILFHVFFFTIDRQFFFPFWHRIDWYHTWSILHTNKYMFLSKISEYHYPQAGLNKLRHRRRYTVCHSTYRTFINLYEKSKHARFSSECLDLHIIITSIYNWVIYIQTWITKLYSNNFCRNGSESFDRNQEFSHDAAISRNYRTILFLQNYWLKLTIIAKLD